jgi:hypothetical protein
MRKPVPFPDGYTPDTQASSGSSSGVAAPGAGDILIEAIANAVALKLERMAGVQQRLMDIHVAAIYLGMTEAALRQKAGVDIPCVRIDGKLRFDRRELDRYIDRAPREGI